MEYTVAIRTLGTAGEKYQRELDSLCAQTIQPKEIIVYIAEGYPIPKETCGRERYVYVKKGMVAQRALPYDEVKTEYILFLDDDVYLPSDGVEHLFKQMAEHGADVIAPNTFENHKMSKSVLLRNMLLGKIMPFESDSWAYKVLKSGGFSFNRHPNKAFYWAESNAGPCFLCKKSDFLKIKFQDELWLDEVPYALPDDQVLFYKMFLLGMKIGTSMDSGIIHLDAGTSVAQSCERAMKILYSEIRNQIIFWHKFIKPQSSGIRRLSVALAFQRYLVMRKLFSFKTFLQGNRQQWEIVSKAIKDGNQYIKTHKL